MPTSPRVPMLAVTALLLVAACAACATPSGTPSASPSLPPGASPSSPPSAEPSSDIDFPTGAADLILQFEQSASQMLELRLAEPPIFSLYGDGTIVYRDPAGQPPADPHGLLRYNALRAGRLTPGQVHELLTFAVIDGGLAGARERYDHPLVADGGTATFRINAGGPTKEVSIYALGLDEGAPDQVARRQFNALVERLHEVGRDASITTADYAPHAWRGVLFEAGGVPARVAAWPWSGIEPSDFVAQGDDPNLPTFPSRALTAAEVAELDLGPLPGGVIGYSTEGPDSKIYSLVVRPLLPDEER